MISFHLDARSGIAPYLQIVGQVRQALLLGLLSEGDKLPTVKEVVAKVAINPNTVSKAYRELEHLGLAAAKPGVGTFITRSQAHASLAEHGPLQQELRAWLEKARAAGLTEPASTRCSRTPAARAPKRRDMNAVLQAHALGKRYGRRQALADCTLARVGYVAQDTPTYASLSVADHLKLGAKLNRRWDAKLAQARIGQLGLDPKQRAGKLSGGQRAQLALTIAVAKQPELLILDEPVASLDPLARRDFLRQLMESVADNDTSVILSSHLVSDLERVCDYLIVLVSSASSSPAKPRTCSRSTTGSCAPAAPR